MEITKQNEQYQINDTTEKYTVSGSLNIYLDGNYSFNITLSDSNTSANYYKSINGNRVNTNYDADASMEADLLAYVEENAQVILNKVANN